MNVQKGDIGRCALVDGIDARSIVIDNSRDVKSVDAKGQIWGVQLVQINRRLDDGLGLWRPCHIVGHFLCGCAHMVEREGGTHQASLVVREN